MWLCMILLTFALALQACGSRGPDSRDADSAARAPQASIPADTGSAVAQRLSAAQRLCEDNTLPTGVQRRVTRGDTLVLQLEHEGKPGPEYLMVDDPSELQFFVVEPYAPEALASNPTPAEFRAMKTFLFQVDELHGEPAYSGAPGAAPVFKEPGVYLLRWGLNFESDAAWVQDSIRVLYCPDG